MAQTSFGESGCVVISIVIATCNNRISVLDCVRAFLTQQGEYEVIVVDQNPKSLDYVSHTLLRVVHADSMGLSAARNVGLRHATGEYVAFVDDDAHPAPDYVNVLAGIMNRKYDLVAGRILLDDEKIPYARTQGPRSGRISRCGWMKLLGGNFAVRKELFDKIGTFDERFGAGAVWASAEESEFLFRALKAGAHAWYEAALVVYHPKENVGHTDESRRGKLYRYAAGQGVVFSKHFHEHRQWVFITRFGWSLLKPLLRVIQFTIMGNKDKRALHADILRGRRDGWKVFRDIGRKMP